MYLQLSLSGDKGGLLCSLPLLQLENWRAKMVVMKGNFALAASLAVCCYNGTLKGSDGGIPAESDYSHCYQPLSLSPPCSGPITNSYTWPSSSPHELCPFHNCSVQLQLPKQQSNSVPTQVNVCKWCIFCPVMLTNFTISVVFLYGVVFCESYSSHPFDAFRCGQCCNLRKIADIMMTATRKMILWDWKYILLEFKLSSTT